MILLSTVLYHFRSALARGGWSSDGTLKRIYRGTMEEYNTVFTEKIIDHFETMQHEMQHDKKKAL
jgi:roadblock/LC7 domain-containing protein